MTVTKKRFFFQTASTGTGELHRFYTFLMGQWKNVLYFISQVPLSEYFKAYLTAISSSTVETMFVVKAVFLDHFVKILLLLINLHSKRSFPYIITELRYLSKGVGRIWPTRSEIEWNCLEPTNTAYHSDLCALRRSGCKNRQTARSTAENLQLAASFFILKLNRNRKCNRFVLQNSLAWLLRTSTLKINHSSRGPLYICRVSVYLVWRTNMHSILCYRYPAGIRGLFKLTLTPVPDWACTSMFRECIIFYAIFAKSCRNVVIS